MTWPTSKWLSVVFTLLLANETWGSNASAESGYNQPTNGGESGNFDVIDVATQKSKQAHLNKMLTGQTTRIILNGEVDDDFWVHHLGEDYKHAVHLMVGGRNDPQNPYRGEHYANAAKLSGVQSRGESHVAQIKSKPEYYKTHESHGTQIKKKPEYYEAKPNTQVLTKTDQHATSSQVDNQHHITKTNDQATDPSADMKEAYEMPKDEQVNETPKENPVDKLENAEYVKEEAEPVVAYTNESIAMTESPSSGNATETHVIKSTDIKPDKDDDNNDGDSSKTTAMQDAKNETQQAALENCYPEGKNYEQIFAIGEKLAHTFYNPNSFDIPDEKPHKTQHYTDTLHKYSTHNKYTHADDSRNTDNKHTQDDQHPTNDREYSGDGDHLEEDKYLTNSLQKPVVINLPESAKSMAQQVSDAETPVVVKMPPVIYHQKPKQYYRPSKKQSTKQNSTPQNTPQDSQQSEQQPQQQQQQILSYPLSQRYANYYSQPQAQQQQPHIYPQYQNSHYNPILANSYDQSSSYTGQNHYQPSTQLTSGHTVDSIPELRYILGKSVGPYSEIRKQLPSNADSSLYDGYTRVSRSYQKYFNDGL